MFNLWHRDRDCYGDVTAASQTVTEAATRNVVADRHTFIGISGGMAVLLVSVRTLRSARKHVPKSEILTASKSVWGHWLGTTTAANAHTATAYNARLVRSCSVYRWFGKWPTIFLWFLRVHLTTDTTSHHSAHLIKREMLVTEFIICMEI